MKTNTNTPMFNFKVYANGHTNDIVTHLISIGCVTNNIIPNDYPFIYVVDSTISGGYNMDAFANSILIEYTADYVLNSNLFDIFTPFQKVLVRDTPNAIWDADIYSYYDANLDDKHICIGSSWVICIPYEGNEHLLGTSDNNK